MTKEPRWLAKKPLLLLHEESLAVFGGSPGIRDEGLLDSALARPRNLHLYQPESTITDLAAGYAYGIARNHPLVDGNKRLAFLALGLFLRMNGHRLIAPQVEAIQTMQALAAGRFDEPQLATWVRRNTETR